MGGTLLIGIFQKLCRVGPHPRFDRAAELFQPGGISAWDVSIDVAVAVIVCDWGHGAVCFDDLDGDDGDGTGFKVLKCVCVLLYRKFSIVKNCT